MKPVLEVVAVAGLCTVQDLGRPGRMHEGIPPGGAVAPGLLMRANGGVRNALGDAVIEAFGTLSVVLHAERAMAVALDDGVTVPLEPGERFDLLPSKNTRVRYLAVRGGIDVPMALGGRGTLLVANLGGFEGRALRRGDRLPIGALAEVKSENFPAYGLPGARPFHVHVGPDLGSFEAEAIKRLLASTFMVSPASDRMGTRLIGPTLLRRGEDRQASAPMVRGAIEVSASGEAIVLGPDHPTTGGYPILAVVSFADVGRLFATPVRGAVRFIAALTDDQEITSPT